MAAGGGGAFRANPQTRCHLNQPALTPGSLGLVDRVCVSNPFRIDLLSRDLVSVPFETPRPREADVIKP